MIIRLRFTLYSPEQLLLQAAGALGLIVQGWGFCGFFRICGFFFQCFQSSAFLRISAVPSFNQREREREMRKKCLQNNPNRASERNCSQKISLTEPQRKMQKNCSQKISLTEPQLCEPLNCERHGQCTLSFC